ncbi:hypothetical protein PA598K_02051 [Paenibacillus sp. 598K]|uniref:ComEC/Rec2 family competence protein n=1 Tax=Paenibacillus sp. 598K TaxID=1117987 RepID=UPI000FFACC8E|nr:ComEC/Rec2 family competence protein [Paenibacillus sp. 598K]GBF73735.1 hypothetical protein PA598K_02051 [Paenibacillus sp. 598K]
MAQRPLIWVTIAWVAGSSAAAALPREGVWLGMAAALAALVALTLLRILPRRVAVVCLIACGLAAGSREWADARNTTGLPELLAVAEADALASYPVEAEGVIIHPVQVDGDRAQLRLETIWLRLADAQEPLALQERLQVRIKLAEEAEQQLVGAWRRGDRLRLYGELKLPDQASNFGGFDYRRYLFSQRIHWLLQVDGAAAIEQSAGATWSKSGWMGKVDSVRANLGARMAALYPEQQGGYMKGLVLGMSDDLDAERFQQFSELGLTHILAISGLHVAVFLYCLHMGLKLLRVPRETSLLLLIAAVPFYVLLSGASPSVVRAGMMSMIGLLAARLGMLKDGLHLLCAAALLMLMIEPYMLGNVSFQMSVIVTAGLIVGVGPLRRALPQWQRGKGVVDLVAVSVAAQLASFPLTIYYFNQFNLISLPANILLVPFISSIVMPIGAVSLALTAVWQPAAQLTADIARLGNDLTFAITDLLNQPDALRSIWPTPSLWWVLLWYAALLAGYRLLPAWRSGEPVTSGPRPRDAEQSGAASSLPGLSARAARGPGDDAAVPQGSPALADIAAVDAPTAPLDVFAQGRASVDQPSASLSAPITPLTPGIAASLLRQWGERLLRHRLSLLRLGLLTGVVLLLGYAYDPDRFDRAAYIEMIDVGQGDAILIRTPQGRHILSDGGGTVRFSKPGEAWRERSDPYEVGRKLLVPLLMKRGVQEIDLLIVSHLDTDHIGGLAAVLETIPVRRLLWNGSVKDAPEASRLFALAAEREIELYPACAPQRWQPEPDVKLEVLWPPSAGSLGCGGTATQLPHVEQQNDYSVVAHLELYGYSLLLSGDLGATGERLLLERLSDRAEPLRADALKVGHHGSRTSTTEAWLRYWQPSTALIPVGRYNWYGHPHPLVIERLAHYGVQVLRTDRDGGIMLRITRQSTLLATRRTP